MKSILLLLILVSTGYGQQPAPKPSIQAESSGKCSPNILSNQGTVQFTCTAVMDKATAAKIVGLLNRIIPQQSSGAGDAEVNRKLDEILAFLRNEALARQPREWPPDQMETAKQMLTAEPATLRIFYVENDGEAYQLATQISELLVSCHWTLKEPVQRVLVVSEGSGPLYGMSLAYHGEAPGHPGDRVNIDSSTPVGILTHVLMQAFPDGFAVDPKPTNDADFVQLIHLRKSEIETSFHRWE